MACKQCLNDIWVDCVDMYVLTGVLYQLKKYVYHLQNTHSVFMPIHKREANIAISS